MEADKSSAGARLIDTPQMGYEYLDQDILLVFDRYAREKKFRFQPVFKNTVDSIFKNDEDLTASSERLPAYLLDQKEQEKQYDNYKIVICDAWQSLKPGDFKNFALYEFITYVKSGAVPLGSQRYQI